MVRLVALLLACFCFVAESQAQENQWTPLFNGKDLSGWHVACKPQDAEKAFWKVEDGAIVCDSIGRKDHDYVWLMTDKEFQDFELRLKFQAFSDSPGNSGLQFRSRFDKTDGNGWLNGPQVDIHPPKPMSWRTGLIYDETRGEQRWIFPSLKDSNMPGEHEPKEHVMKYAEDGWNELTLICEGMQIKTIVNGIVRTDWNATGILDNEAHRKHNVGQKGHFALQLHSRDELKIKFKDIEIRELADPSESARQTAIQKFIEVRGRDQLQNYNTSVKEKPEEWVVFFDGKIPMPGNHAMVVIDKAKGEVRYVGYSARVAGTTSDIGVAVIHPKQKPEWSAAQ